MKTKKYLKAAHKANIVRQFRGLRRDGTGVTEAVNFLAKKYDVCRGTVNNIIKHETGQLPSEVKTRKVSITPTEVPLNGATSGLADPEKTEQFSREEAHAVLTLTKLGWDMDPDDVKKAISVAHASLVETISS